MKEVNNQYEAAEVQLTYKNNKRVQDRFQIKNQEDAARVFHEIWDPDTIDYVEEVKILLLNRAHHILGIATVSKGGVVGTIVDIKIIMQYALKANASSIIVAHNHPSGRLSPSEGDRAITTRLMVACEALDIKLLDHIIINSEGQHESITV